MHNQTFNKLSTNKAQSIDQYKVLIMLNKIRYKFSANYDSSIIV
jgi:hypothetical protein